MTDAGGATATFGPLSADVRLAPGPAAVDTTGAGDAFAAALVAALLDADGAPTEPALREALERAVELAGAVARTAGAQARVAPEGAAP